MTREEAYKLVMRACKETWNDKTCEQIKEVLEQQPCEDAISRKAVLDKLNKLIEVERLQGTDEMGYGRERVSAYECMIHSIESEYLYPSVNPQQPGDDCISRQEAINCVTSNEFRYKIVEDIKTLPSVTPKEKTGRWLHREDMDYLDENKVRHNHFMCKDCGFIHDFVDGHTAQYKYCPNCGAKIEEVENDTN